MLQECLFRPSIFLRGIVQAGELLGTLQLQELSGGAVFGERDGSLFWVCLGKMARKCFVFFGNIRKTLDFFF